MKLPSLISVLFLCATGCSTIHRIDSTQLEVISVPRGMQDAARMEEMQKRISQGERYVFKVAQGEPMPLRLTLDLPIGQLEKAEARFVFSHDTYFLMSQKQFCVSPDGQRWADVGNRRALGKLFGFKRGEFSFGFSATSNEPPFMEVKLKAK